MPPFSEGCREAGRTPSPASLSLQNLELARAMGFCDEEGEYELVGNIFEVTKENGNAVPVRTAAAPVKAILDPTGQSGGGHDDTDNRGRSRVDAAP